jgi:hypothetical protein
MATSEIATSDRRQLLEPVGLTIVMFVLLGISAVVGIYPQLLLTTIESVIRGLTFVHVSS